MKKQFLLILMLTTIFAVSAQDKRKQAMAYFFTAENAYKTGNYDKAIDYCNQVETMLGSTNAVLELLRIKTYADKGDVREARTSLETFFTLESDEHLLEAVAPYIAKIETAENEQKLQQKLAAKRAAEKAEYDRTHITCGLCNGRGRYEAKEDCDYCNYGKRDCKTTCTNCKGKGRFHHGTAVGYSNCWQCNGTGKKTVKCNCNYCDGIGYDMVTKTCIQCKGKGDVLK